MDLVNEQNELSIDLFHGTSTLFMDDIIAHGLGGFNPVREWGLLELSKEVFAQSELHLRETEIYLVKSNSFRLMTEQVSGGSFNWQHGETYVSPSKQTGINYAINKRYGSELLTYTIDFLQALIEKKVKYVTTDLFRKYKKIFGLIEANPSPLLVQISNVPLSVLRSEHGEAPDYNLEQMEQVLSTNLEAYQAYLQQTNFRLVKPISMDKLKLWFINVQEWRPYNPQYNLYHIYPDL